MGGVGKERMTKKMHDFQFVSKAEYLPAKKELEQIINLVQDEVRSNFTFSFTYVGSTNRHLISKDVKSNVGYDFDVNIHVNDEEEDFSPEKIRRIIRLALDKHARKFGYDYAEDSTRVITIKKKDYWSSRITYSCDFAIVYDCNDGRQQFIHFNKKQKSYTWQYMPVSNKELEKRADWLKSHNKWDEVKSVYIYKKNVNDNPDRRSRSLYAETINELYHKYCKK